MQKVIKARITIHHEDGAETDVNFSAETWEQLIADISRFGDSDDAQEKNFIQDAGEQADAEWEKENEEKLGK